MNFYEISVQRFTSLPAMLKLKCIDHFWSDDGSRLTVVTCNGDSISFPEINKRVVKVHASYRKFKESQQLALAPAMDEIPIPLELAPEPLPEALEEIRA